MRQPSSIRLFEGTADARHPSVLKTGRLTWRALSSLGGGHPSEMSAPLGGPPRRPAARGSVGRCAHSKVLVALQRRAGPAEEPARPDQLLVQPLQRPCSAPHQAPHAIVSGCAAPARDRRLTSSTVPRRRTVTRRSPSCRAPSRTGGSGRRKSRRTSPPAYHLSGIEVPPDRAALSARSRSDSDSQIAARVSRSPFESDHGWPSGTLSPPRSLLCENRSWGVFPFPSRSE